MQSQLKPRTSKLRIQRLASSCIRDHSTLSMASKISSCKGRKNSKKTLRMYKISNQKYRKETDRRKDFKNKRVNVRIHNLKTVFQRFRLSQRAKINSIVVKTSGTSSIRLSLPRRTSRQLMIWPPTNSSVLPDRW
jgi:hypothetical protein